MKRHWMVLILFLAGGCWFFAGSAFAAPDPEPEEILDSLTQNIQELKDLSTLRSRFDKVLQRDPMQPLVDANGHIIKAETSREGLEAQGVVWGHDFKTVLIGEKFYSVGDQVGAYKIVEIGPTGFFAVDADGKRKRFIPLYKTENEAASVPPA